MLKILEGARGGQVCRMNDVLMFVKDKLEHDKRFKEVLGRLLQCELVK